MKYLANLAIIVGCLALVFPVSVQGQDYWFSRSNDKAFLGVESERLSKTKAELLGFSNRYGNYISKVIENTAAEKAGLQPFDYITGIGDDQLEWTTELTDLLSHYKAGDEATIHFIRKGKAQKVKVTFTTRSSKGYSVFASSSRKPFLGVSSHGESKDDEMGVKVNIVDGSTADALGLKDGDVIEMINGFPMIDWSDITSAINMMEIEDPVEITFRRNGTLYTKSGKITARASNPISNYFSWGQQTSSDRAFLGIYSEDISQDKADQLGIDNPYGSYVTGILSNTAAEQAGLKPFDYVYGVDEYRVGENQSLTTILRKYEAGEEATIHYIRKGQLKTAKVKFGSRSEASDKKRDDCEDPFLGVQQSHRSSDDKGVRVDVVSNSTAAAIGLQDGDMIIAINGYKMISWEDIGPAVDMNKVGDQISISLLRDGKKMEVSGKIKSRCETKKSDEDDNNSWFPWSWSNDQNDEVDVSEMDIALSDPTDAEIKDFNSRHDLDMPLNKSLAVGDLKLYPNPKMGMFRLQFNLATRGETVVQIFNSNGRQIYKYDLGSFSGEFSDDIDLSQNGAGTYFLQIAQGAKSNSKKITLENK